MKTYQVEQISNYISINSLVTYPSLCPPPKKKNTTLSVTLIQRKRQMHEEIQLAQVCINVLRKTEDVESTIQFISAPHVV